VRRPGKSPPEKDGSKEIQTQEIIRRGGSNAKKRSIRKNQETEEKNAKKGGLNIKWCDRT